MNLGLPPLPLERLQKLLPALAALLLTVLIALELARLIWLLVPAPEGGAWVPRPAQSPQRQSREAGDGINIPQMLAAKLFGDYSASPQEVAAPSTVDAPDTNLRLTLRGIFAMEDEGSSRALIEPANGELKPYAVGMDIPGGARLHSIKADRVLLQRGGRLETLRLDKDKPSESEVPISLSQRQQAVAASQIIDSGTAAKLSNIRTELLNDPTKASEYLRVQPARRNGQLHGYRIYPGRNRELFREAGLRPGDIVTAINGVNLDDPSKSLQLLGDLSQAQNINLQVERGGRTQSLSVTLN